MARLSLSILAQAWAEAHLVNELLEGRGIICTQLATGARISNASVFQSWCGRSCPFSFVVSPWVALWLAHAVASRSYWALDTAALMES